MFFNDKKKNIAFFITAGICFFIASVLFLGNYEKQDNETRNSQTKYIKGFIGFTGLVALLIIIYKNIVNGEILDIGGVLLERGLVIYLFFLFFIAFSF
jgi:hypothetical protein